MHLFITGQMKVGKTTLINQLLGHINSQRIYGFYTQKVMEVKDDRIIGSIYMLPAGNGTMLEEKYCVADILKEGGFDIHLEGFEVYGYGLLKHIPKGSIVVMDELGFLENQAFQFCQQVLHVLDQEVTVIGVIKNKSTSFLEKVKHHPRVHLNTLTVENRETLAKQLINLLKEQDYNKK